MSAANFSPYSFLRDKSERDRSRGEIAAARGITKAELMAEVDAWRKQMTRQVARRDRHRKARLSEQSGTIVPVVPKRSDAGTNPVAGAQRPRQRRT